MRNGACCGAAETNAPTPCRVTTSPSARSAATASRTTVRLTRAARDSSSSVGRRAPARQAAALDLLGELLEQAARELALAGTADGS